jgi:hypothetical protein
MPRYSTSQILARVLLESSRRKRGKFHLFLELALCLFDFHFSVTSWHLCVFVFVTQHKRAIIRIFEVLNDQLFAETFTLRIKGLDDSNEVVEGCQIALDLGFHISEIALISAAF